MRQAKTSHPVWLEFSLCASISFCCKTGHANCFNLMYLFSYAICEWSRMFWINKVLFCSVLLVAMDPKPLQQSLIRLGGFPGWWADAQADMSYRSVYNVCFIFLQNRSVIYLREGYKVFERKWTQFRGTFSLFTLSNPIKSVIKFRIHRTYSV